MEDERWYRFLVLITLSILTCALTAEVDAQGVRPSASPGLTTGASLPPADIPVLENSRGDVVHDSVVNLLDFLRLRDILAGRPPAPTSYEQVEADVTVDGSVTLADLDLLRTILLRKAGVPYLIDSTGGTVRGDGITLTIPPGAVDSTTVFSVRRNSESEFASEFGVNTGSAEQDSAYFMASFEIFSSNVDFKLPVNATIKLDSVPPCAYQGLNGLFAAVPDRDGDGRVELFLINELLPDADSLTLSTKGLAIPTIQTISHSQAEPGKSITISGTGFGNDPPSVLVRFSSIAHPDSFENVRPLSVEDSAIIVVVPGMSAGQYHMIIHNTVSGVNSNVAAIDILPFIPVVGDIRSVIVGFYIDLAARWDSLNVDSPYAAVEDTLVRNYVTELGDGRRAYIDTQIVYFSGLPDSLLGYFASLASYLQSISPSNGIERKNFSTFASPPDPCPACTREADALYISKLHLMGLIKAAYDLTTTCSLAKQIGSCEGCDAAKKAWQEILELTDYMADREADLADCKCDKCSIDCASCKNTAFVGWGPESKRVSGGYGPSGFNTNGVCINIIRYKRNQCAQIVRRVPADFQSADRLLQSTDCFKFPAYGPSSISSGMGNVLDSRAHPGSIVRITNASVPYNIVGILNDNGQAFIPHVPLSTKVTFSLYDPVTGFFDPHVGTYTTGSTPGGFDHPLLVFNPNTTVRTIPIHIGDVVQDSISLTTYERTDYVLTIGPADTSSLLSIGFRSSVPMALKIEDPDGALIVDSMNTLCYPGLKLKFDKIGAYRIRISFGTGLQPGSYAFGIHYYPEPPIDRFYMCGRFVFDTLLLRFSPYLISDPITIPLGDNIIVEPGVTLSFDHNGSILSYGTLFGTGSHESPIRLLPFTGLSQENIVKRDRSVKNALIDGKEVQP